MTAEPNSNLEELKARVDLVDLIKAAGVDLKKTGKNYVGLCPFHDDSNPSLSVSREKQLWNCLACSAGGDALNFLQLKEKLDFPMAVERLRDLAGEIPALRVKPAEPPPDFKRPDLLARVAELYHKRFLEIPDGRDYLSGRGLNTVELWKAFQVGFCDGSLRKSLPEDGPILESLKAIGVLTAEGKEHFRGCVVVPLTHPDKGVVGLYGRRIRPDAKNRHLYLSGPHQGVLNWQALKSSPSVFITESILDALSLWQSGVREATCLFGVQGIPHPLAELLQRFNTREVVLCLDGDRAGAEAVQKLVPDLQKLGLEVYSVRLPDGQDPNSVLTESGSEALCALLKKKETLKSPAPEAAPISSEKGLELELGEVHYSAQMMPPFSSRLRLNLRATRDEKWLQDRFDLYLHRDRARLLQQLTTQLQLPRVEAERHQQALFKACEEWVQRHKAAQNTEVDAKKPPEMNGEEREESLRFLRQPNLAQLILDDMEALGYVGEEKAKLLAYLIGISRKLPKPLSGIILSQSGCGKSTLTEIIEQLTPPEDVLLFTRITAQALIYIPEGLLKGKLLIVEERVGAEAAEYSIRILQSRQRLTQAVPLKDPLTGKITTHILTVEGPVAYLETTTDPRINHENATRCFEITLDESDEQTERILKSQRAYRLPSRKNRHRESEAILKRHHQAQRLLEAVLVFIPYADKLTFPSKRLRNRRDNERFLCLIEASAFLHQHQRERGKTDDGDSYVLANLEDYRLAYDLAKEVLATTLHELSRGAKDIWEKIRDWAVGEGGLESYSDLVFTRRDLRKVTGAEDHQLRSALQELVDMEYLEIAGGAVGKAFHYRLLVARDEDVPVALLSPEELERRL